MASVQYGTIVTEIKGKNQGHIFQGGNVGFVLRSKGYTKGLSTASRSTSSALISYIASQWRVLSNANRLAWAAIVPNWLFYNRFGVAYQGSAYQVFMAYNKYLINTGAALATVPVAINVPTNPGAKTLAYSLAGTLSLSWINAGIVTDHIMFFASAPVSAGRNDNNPRLKYIGLGGADSVTTFDLTTMYTTVFNAPNVGERVIVRSYWQDDNWMYPYYDSNASCLVTA